MSVRPLPGKRIMLLLIGLSALSWLGSCRGGAAGSSSEPSPAEGSLRYLALGDSYTIGEGVGRGRTMAGPARGPVAAAGVAVGEPQIIARTGWTVTELSDGNRCRRTSRAFRPRHSAHRGERPVPRRGPGSLPAGFRPHAHPCRRTGRRRCAARRRPVDPGLGSDAFRSRERARFGADRRRDRALQRGQPAGSAGRRGPLCRHHARPRAARPPSPRCSPGTASTTQAECMRNGRASPSPRWQRRSPRRHAADAFIDRDVR